MIKPSRRFEAQRIKYIVGRYLVKKRFGVTFEFGLNRGGALRADVMAIKQSGHTIIVEVKTCKADFMTDHKYEQYLQFCNKFYFAFNQETYEKVKHLIPKGIGIMVVSQMRSLVVRQPARNIEPEQEIVYSIALRMAYRGATFKDLKSIDSTKPEIPKPVDLNKEFDLDLELEDGLKVRKRATR